MRLEVFLEHARRFSLLGEGVGEQLMAAASSTRTNRSVVDEQGLAALYLAAEHFLRPLATYLATVDPEDRELGELRNDVFRLWLSLPSHAKVTYKENNGNHHAKSQSPAPGRTSPRRAS